MDSTSKPHDLHTKKHPPEEIDLRQTRREHVHRHYSRAISMAHSALDDGSKSPQPSRDLTEWLLSKLGFHCKEWTQLTDEELASFICAPARLSDEITHDRTLKRIRKARERLLKWQAKAGNPILIEYELRFVHAEDSEPGRPKGKHYPWYRLPFGELIAEIIEEAPVGTRADRLKRIVKRHVDNYLARFGGAYKRDKKKKEHSPESDLKRSATIAKKAVERAEKKSGQQSAVSEFVSVFSREFCGLVRFSPFDHKSNNGNNLDPESVQDNCHVVFPDKSPIPNDLTQKPCATSVTSISAPKSAEIRHESQLISVTQLSASGRAERGCDSHPPAPRAMDEHRALETFRSVGCGEFEWFFVDPATDKKTGAYHLVNADEFAAEVTELVGDAERGGVSFVARVRGPVLQLDDCDSEVALLLEPFTFVVIETSKNNFQCWLAFKDERDKAEARACLFAGLRKLAPGVNHGAGGAVRWPGSINAKPSRNGWRVRVDSANLGRFVTPSELDDAALLGDPPALAEINWQTSGAPGAWPDYERCLKDKGGDRSKADWQFVCYALKRRWSPKEIAAKLAEISDKAKEGGERYINRTIASAVAHLGLEVAQ
jgi:hypothetical protein